MMFERDYGLSSQGIIQDGGKPLPENGRLKCSVCMCNEVQGTGQIY